MCTTWPLGYCCANESDRQSENRLDGSWKAQHWGHKGTEQNSLELFVQRQGDLWRDIDEALTQQQPHRLACVTEDLLQLFRHAVGGVLLTLTHDQLLHLLHALHTLPDTHVMKLNYRQMWSSYIIIAPSSQLFWRFVRASGATFLSVRLSRLMKPYTSSGSSSSLSSGTSACWSKESRQLNTY